MSRLSIALIAAFATLSLSSTAAVAASGGNSAAAKTCQKGGSADVVRPDQTLFKNTGDCVAYAAQGGTLAPPTPPAPPKIPVPAEAYAICQAAGGYIYIDQDPNNVYWCVDFQASSYSGAMEVIEQLRPVCESVGAYQSYPYNSYWSSSSWNSFCTK